MSIGVSFEGDYSKKQWGLVTNLVAGVPQPLPTVDPAGTAANLKMVKPEKIVVQALPTNQGVAIVGPKFKNDGVTVTTLPDDGSQGGFQLAPGEMQVLPSRAVADWVIAGSIGGGQAVSVLFHAGPN